MRNYFGMCPIYSKVLQKANLVRNYVAHLEKNRVIDTCYSRKEYRLRYTEDQKGEKVIITIKISTVYIHPTCLRFGLKMITVN